MNIVWRKFAAVCTVGAGAFLLAAAGMVVTGIAPKETVDAKGTEEEIIFWYEDASYREYFEKAADDYFEKTGSKVQAVYIDTLDYMGDIYNATMQDTEYPDVYLIGGDSLEEACLYGLARENTNTQIYSKASGQALLASAYREKTYGYPLSFKSCVFVCQNGYFDGQPESLQAIIDYSDENEPPENVEYLLEWDVNDPFYDFPFISNCVTFEKTESEVMNVVYDMDLYEQDMAYFEQILESFSIDADTVSKETILSHFLAGKTLCAIIDTSDLWRLAEYDYTLMQIPDLNGTLKADTCAATDMLIVNGFSKRAEQAADFAAFATTQEAGSLLDYTGYYSVILPDTLDAAAAAAYESYESAVLIPDSQDAKEFWIQLEATIHKYF